MNAPAIPLANIADAWLGRLARLSAAPALQSLDAPTLLGERATLAGYRVPARIAASANCALFEAADDRLALSLSRATDRELLPALFERDDVDTDDDAAIAALIAQSRAAGLVERGRLLGLAISAVHAAEHDEAEPSVRLHDGLPATRDSGRPPRVVDLSALWAGPLCGHLLWLAGAELIKVESLRRPDAMRGGAPEFFSLLNQGKASVVLDFADAAQLQALRKLIASADIVIEAARPRALRQLGIEAERFVDEVPGLSWISITGHGATGEAANWIGFGDDCGVAAGLSAALEEASGSIGFVGDAIADPLTGIYAAMLAFEAWRSRRGGHHAVAMTRVAAHALAIARQSSPQALADDLRAWSAAAGEPFARTRIRAFAAAAEFGRDTARYASLAC